MKKAGRSAGETRRPAEGAKGAGTRSGALEQAGADALAESLFPQTPPAPARQQAETGDELLEQLREAGFEWIDNRTASSIVWVLYDPEKKETFEKIFSGRKESYRLEARGAEATELRPAWRVMFGKG